jgi:class 3 adenylate cyclase
VPVPAPTTTVEAERRQLTVMFCDLVGSTALSSRLDPEDLREVIAAHHRAVAGIVAGFDGFVAKYMGDGVLVYFGYPRAHEDDAARAIRAGLGLIDAVGRLDVKSTKLQARVGIATGLVVVGDLIGEGSAQEQAVVGETSDLAARLQAFGRAGCGRQFRGINAYAAVTAARARTTSTRYCSYQLPSIPVPRSYTSRPSDN